MNSSLTLVEGRPLLLWTLWQILLCTHTRCLLQYQTTKANPQRALVVGNRSREGHPAISQVRSFLQQSESFLLIRNKRQQRAIELSRVKKIWRKINQSSLSGQDYKVTFLSSINLPNCSQAWKGVLWWPKQLPAGGMAISRLSRLLPLELWWNRWQELADLPPTSSCQTTLSARVLHMPKRYLKWG